jgi:hypothetical protein
VASLTLRKLLSNGASIKHCKGIISRECSGRVSRRDGHRWNRCYLCDGGFDQSESMTSGTNETYVFWSRIDQAVTRQRLLLFKTTQVKCKDKGDTPAKARVRRAVGSKDEKRSGTK